MVNVSYSGIIFGVFPLKFFFYINYDDVFLKKSFSLSIFIKIIIAIGLYDLDLSNFLIPIFYLLPV